MESKFVISFITKSKSADLLKTFGKSPSLSNHRDDGWIASPYTEMNATTHKHYVEFDLDRCVKTFGKYIKGKL